MADSLGTECRFFRAGQCASCTLMPLPHPEQIAHAQADLERRLERAAQRGLSGAGAHPRAGAHPGAGKVSGRKERPASGALPALEWYPPIMSTPWGFRAKAKMAVQGTAAAPVFTFPGAPSTVDLSDCPLYPPLVTEVLLSAREVIRRAQIPPYSVEKKRGEIKYVLVTASDSEALVRFVLRSDSALERLREHVTRLDPRAVSVSANLQPEHAAILEGPTDIHLAGADRLRLHVGPVTLGVLPRSFTQTNTAVAAELYAQVAEWILDSGARSVWDLYCGVGGFSLTLAHAAHERAAREHGASITVHGVEITEAAVRSARDSARELGLEAPQVQFTASDAAAWAAARLGGSEARTHPARPDALIVNPPRRGLTADVAQLLNSSGIRMIAYSSCNPVTLAEDLTEMPNYRVAKARLVDMFPHTRHNEAVVLLIRKEAV